MFLFNKISFSVYYVQKKKSLSIQIEMIKMSKEKIWGLPSGPGVKNLPPNAGDTGSIPDPGRSHVLRRN